MARLPSGRFLIQQIGSEVILFEDFTEREIVRFPAADADAMCKAQKVISDSDMSVEDVCFAHLWSGYFYAYACMGTPAVGIEELSIEYMRDRILREAGKNLFAEAGFIPQGVIGGRLRMNRPPYETFEKEPPFEKLEIEKFDLPSGYKPAQYSDLGVTNEEVATGEDYGKYDLPNLRKEKDDE